MAKYDTSAAGFDQLKPDGSGAPRAERVDTGWTDLKSDSGTATLRCRFMRI